MSYDVTIGDYWSNYTWNGSEFFYDHMDGGIDSLDGLTGKQAYERLEDWFRSVRTESRKRPNGQSAHQYFSKKYDPDNNWGDVMAQCLWIAELISAFKANSRKKVRVS